MKSLFYPKTLLAMAVAIAATTAAVSQAQNQPSPPATADSALPSGIVPGSPLAEVVKMLQAGVDAPTIKSYVLNSQSPFNLDADEILFLKDEGAPSDLINAMMDRDKTLFAATLTPPPAPVAPPVAPPAPDSGAPGGPDASAPGSPDAAPPADAMTLNDFNATLSPYGTWVDVEGYGRCWRPTVSLYDPNWVPYGDRGHWTYTDYGWYWDSDYAWGTTFHYGRWFRTPRLGWCWYPDTVWAPSWVTWRSGEDCYGWAPLPPFAVFRPGVGFFYRGVQVGADFDFGLGADAFMFVDPGHFFDRHPRSFFLGRDRAMELYHHSTVINHFDAHDRFMVNHGFAVERMASVTHHQIETVHIRDLPNAGRQGWRGAGFEHTLRPENAYPGRDMGHDAGHGFAPGRNDGHDEFHHGPETFNPEPRHDLPSPGGHPIENRAPEGNGQLRHDTPEMPSHQPAYSVPAEHAASPSHNAPAAAPPVVPHSQPASGQGQSSSHNSGGNNGSHNGSGDDNNNGGGHGR